MEQAIIWSIPVLALAVLIEFIVSVRRGRKTYRGNDTLANLSQGVISQLIGACTPLLQIGIYTLVFSYLGHALELPFWHTWYGFALAVVMFDFCEYWLHRVGHEVSVFWAAHVVHHQGEELNICTALRQESQNAVLGWPFYLPMAIAGVPPEVFAFSLLFVQYYQIWAHTEQVGKLGWLDGVFTTPSNHRVHHAVNDCYLDRNYGGLFVLWDRLFGTYAVETIQKIIAANVPVFGICLGHQMLGLALGAKTVKMAQGHHGANHPVQDLSTGKVEIVSMNHGFAVDRESLPDGVIETHVSLFDGSNCGIALANQPVFSVQYHPEASPGPKDSFYLFERFRDAMRAHKQAQ
jgi:sterol desaturase/sphingolipid hydroxylase (fatty acid hydroxylase superfamily)